jgi:hypothetical protein
MSEHNEDTDDHVRSLIRAHLTDHGEFRVDKLYAACALHGYSQDEVIELLKPIKAARRAAGDLAIMPGNAELPPAVAPPEPTFERTTAIPAPEEPRRLATLRERMLRIDEDVAKMRDYSLKPDGSIKFPLVFMTMVGRQLDALEMNRKVGEALFNLDRLQGYFQGLSDIIRERIGPLSPEVQAAILADLDKLNAEFLSLGSYGT